MLRLSVGLVAAVLFGFGLFVAGRASVDAAHGGSYQMVRIDGYFDGLRAGEAQGRREGRALQEGQSLPANARRRVRSAFDDGYVAGANDVFAGYDGGWALGTSYVVTIEQGGAQIVYRIKSRDRMQPNVDYFLCPNGHDLCHEPR
jgi:hypothetical protein